MTSASAPSTSRYLTTASKRSWRRPVDLGGGPDPSAAPARHAGLLRTTTCRIRKRPAALQPEEYRPARVRRFEVHENGPGRLRACRCDEALQALSLGATAHEGRPPPAAPRCRVGAGSWGSAAIHAVGSTAASGAKAEGPLLHEEDAGGPCWVRTSDRSISSRSAHSGSCSFESSLDGRASCWGLPRIMACSRGVVRGVLSRATFATQRATWAADLAEDGWRVAPKTARDSGGRRVCTVDRPGRPATAPARHGNSRDVQPRTPTSGTHSRWATETEGVPPVQRRLPGEPIGPVAVGSTPLAGGQRPPLGCVVGTPATSVDGRRRAPDRFVAAIGGRWRGVVSGRSET